LVNKTKNNLNLIEKDFKIDRLIKSIERNDNAEKSNCVTDVTRKKIIGAVAAKKTIFLTQFSLRSKHFFFFFFFGGVRGKGGGS